MTVPQLILQAGEPEDLTGRGPWWRRMTGHTVCRSVCTSSSARAPATSTQRSQVQIPPSLPVSPGQRPDRQERSGLLIFMAAWRQQDLAAQAGGGCHEPDLIGTPERPIWCRRRLNTDPVSPNPLGRRRRHATATDAAVRGHLGRGGALPPSGGTARAGWNLGHPAGAGSTSEASSSCTPAAAWIPARWSGRADLLGVLAGDLDTLRGLAASWTGMARVSTPAV